MEPIFTIPYPEFAVATHLERLFKQEKITIAFPASRQNKGWDLLAFHGATGRAARVQVKSSRGYAGSPPRSYNDRLQVRLNQFLWFNRFEPDHDQADFYVLVGLYENPTARAGDRALAYRRIYLLFTAGEMARFMSPVGHSFDLAFDSNAPRCIIRSKGAEARYDECYESFQLDRRVKDLRAFFNGNDVDVVEPLRHGITAVA